MEAHSRPPKKKYINDLLGMTEIEILLINFKKKSKLYILIQNYGFLNKKNEILNENISLELLE